jgi:hypothetical protein
MVNTHYMVDGHPIHNKDPMSIDHSSYEIISFIHWMIHKSTKIASASFRSRSSDSAKEISKAAAKS